MSKSIRNVSGGLGQFKSLLASHSKGMTVVHFWADWAEQCGPMDEAIKILADDKDLDLVQFMRVEAETEADVSMELEVAAVPTLLFFSPKGKKLLERVEGAKVPDVVKKVRDLNAKTQLDIKADALKAAAAEAAGTAVKEDPSDMDMDLNSRLKKLISAAPAMLFMKGTPAAPECGFSRTTVALLAKHKAKYGHFDILRDNEVRQGLKEYSKWPTYPQLYVNGELLGGLDILKEMDEAGELAEALPKEEEEEEDINKRLEKLTKQADVMVFMKGNPSEPRCGFSRQLMEILSPLGVPFQTFDILGDEEVRQGLKAYSKWPTYPQVYAKGELVGGLDIVKELMEEGELKDALQGKN